MNPNALLNRVRGLLAERGVIVARYADRLLRALPALTEDPRLRRSLQSAWLEQIYRSYLELLNRF